MAAESKDDKSHTTDAELWLEGLGLRASAMDPSSLEALADVLSGQHVDFDESRGGQDDPSSTTTKRQRTVQFKTEEREFKESLEMVVEKELLRMLDKDQKLPAVRVPGQHDALPSFLLRRLVQPDDEDERIAIPDEATAVERLILQKLGEQSKMLKNLERRLDALTLDNRISSAASSTTTRPADAAVDPQQQRHPAAAFPRFAAHVREPPRPQVMVFPQPPPARAGPPPAVHHRGPGGAAFGIATRFRKCFNLFVSLRRHQVPNERIDGWMLVKIMFMLSILLSKDQGKLFTTLTVVFLGFLWQSGLAGFLYKFIVRYNYVGRIIFYDEDITFASALAEQQLQQQQPPPIALARNGAAAAPANDQEQRPPWYHVDPNRHFVVNVLIDIVMLIGSLFLSIFPMWRVPDPPVARNEPPPEAAAAAGGDADTHLPAGNNNNNQQPQQHDGTIPVVRPPIDPAADPDDDDDHDENRDDNDDN
jgi:hypothetical protein